MAAKKTKAKAKKATNPDPVDESPDLGEVFAETAEQDAVDVKHGQAAERVKQCHLFATEAQMLLQCARRGTATTAIIDAELKRVIELTKEMKKEANAAREALQL